MALGKFLTWLFPEDLRLIYVCTIALDIWLLCSECAERERRRAARDYVVALDKDKQAHSGRDDE